MIHSLPSCPPAVQLIDSLSEKGMSPEHVSLLPLLLALDLFALCAGLVLYRVKFLHSCCQEACFGFVLKTVLGRGHSWDS